MQLNPSRFGRYVLRFSVLAVAYFAAGKLGLALAFFHPSASPVWPAAGIGLAGVMLGGYGLCPAITLAAFLLNLHADGFLPSLAIALGNTLEALLGAYLVNRFANRTRAFERAPDVFRFAFLAGVVSTSLSATVGAMSLCLGGLAPRGDYGSVWLTWWAGDVSGILLIAPLLILWNAPEPPVWTRSQVLEVLGLLALLSMAGLSAFTSIPPFQTPNLYLGLICVPPLLWAAFRLGPRLTALAAFILATVAITGTLEDLRNLSNFFQNEALLSLQASLAAISVMALAVAAEVWERRRQKADLQRYADTLRQQAQLLDTAHVLIRDMEGRIVLWNSGAERLYGWTKEQALGQKSHDLLRTQLPEPVEQIQAKLLRDGRWQGEVAHTTSGGEQIHVASLWVLHRDALGKPAAILEVNNDITERNRVEQQLRQSLREKDTLLREIHHRVKNNLQIVSSLLNLQTAYYRDDYDRQLSLETQGRIRSIALLHNLLYKSRSLEAINFAEYLGILTSQLLRAQSLDREAIRLDLDIDPVQFHIETAMPCALIVNELVSNSIRHAFPNGKGEIRIELHRNPDGSCTLKVADNGVGLPEHLDIAQSKTLGLQLVSSLTEQLGATLHIERGPGASFEFHFSDLEYPSRD